MEADPGGFYVGCALVGVGLGWLFVRFFTLFRLFMVLIFSAGALVSALGGLLLTLPLEGYLPLWVGPCVGLLVWCVAVAVDWSGRSAHSHPFSSDPGTRSGKCIPLHPRQG
jgi:hypothetical protein